MLNRFRMLVACALTFALCWVPGFAFAGDAEDGAQVAATAHGLSYGIEGFERLAKGTARAMEGQPEGYRFPVDEDVDLVVAPAADRVVVWISPKAIESMDLIRRTTSAYRVSRPSSVSSTAQTAWEVRS